MGFALSILVMPSNYPKEAATRHHPVAHARDPRPVSETVKIVRGSDRMPTLPPAVGVIREEDESDVPCTD